MIVPKRMKNIDTNKFCTVLGITRDVFEKKLKEATDYSRYKASVFIKQMPLNEYAVLAERLYKYPGFYGQERTLRKYPSPIAAHLLGYISEIDEKTLNKNKSYQKGEYIGVSGLEQQYETMLRGKPGVEVLLVDVHNSVQGHYKNGAHDTISVNGTNLYISIDKDLQEYGEKLMQNKKGGIVAIEPSSGEILCMVSSPGYDPNLLIGRKRSDNYRMLVANDSLKPLFNRALMAQYPPGSIFKLVQGLIGLEEGAITEHTSFPCNKSLVGCHNHPTAFNLTRGIQYSCNPYFFNVFRSLIQQNKTKSIFKDSELGLEEWYKYVKRFGFGRKLGIDFPVEKTGIVPDVNYYDKIYGHGHWAFSTIYSLGIGQGELEINPLQMANLSAIIANHGYYYIPHFIKSNAKNMQVPSKYKQRMNTGIKPEYFDLVREAMRRVVEEPHGTARRARIQGITVCGKTGTAQNPHGDDHSVFIAFAPMKSPQIAISVYIENAGFGGSWAAPVASLMIEKYINKDISDTLKEGRIINADFIHVNDEKE